jgi:hypothetical protein
MYTSLLSTSLILRRKPMLYDKMNKLELFNEMFLFYTAYFMLICTEWVDVGTRYDMGYFYLGFIILTSFVNVMVVVLSMYKDIWKALRKRKYMKHLKKMTDVKNKIKEKVRLQMHLLKPTMSAR